MSKDYYQILGVSKDASQDEIKKKYRKLSLQHHPDRGGDAEKFKEVSEAYEHIGDNENRVRYDREKSNPFMSGGMNHDDIFGMMFGGGFPGGFSGGFPGGPNVQIFRNGVPVHNPMQRAMPIIKNIEITLQQAYNGCKLPIEIERWIVVDGNKQNEKETIYVDIPEGIDENEIIILKNKGNVISETNKGEIKLFIKIINNTDFVRNGLDLFFKKQITLKESLCGFSFDMKYIDNRTFKINNSDGTIIESNYRKMIPKMGLKRNGHIGNLIIEFTVKFPEKLTKDQITKLKEIL